MECGTTDTPLWRANPINGVKNLCNACGVRANRLKRARRAEAAEACAQGQLHKEAQGGSGLPSASERTASVSSSQFIV